MPRNVLFLVHGVGEHGDDWAKEPIATLTEAARKYEFFQKPGNEDLRGLIELVPIRYDDIFERILVQWSSLAEGLGGAIALAPEALAQALSYLKTCGDDDNTFLRYGGDVLLYRGFRLFAQRVQIRIISMIARKIAERRAEPGGGTVRFSVLAHSMGTAVAHDAIHLLGTEQWLAHTDGDENEFRSAKEARDELVTTTIANPFAPVYFRFDRIFMVANTSVLLHTTSNGPYNSIVKPNTPGNPDSYCHRYYNFAHRWDPVSRALPFRMPGAWQAGDHGVEISGLDHLYDENIHALSHYLKHPDVHLRILSGLVDAYEITDDDMAAANAFPRICPKMTAAARSKIESKLKVLSRKLNAKSGVEKWVRVYREFREWMEA